MSVHSIVKATFHGPDKLQALLDASEPTTEAGDDLIAGSSLTV